MESSFDVASHRRTPLPAPTPYLHPSLNYAGFSTVEFRLLAHIYSARGAMGIFKYRQKDVSAVTGISAGSHRAAFERLDEFGAIVKMATGKRVRTRLPGLLVVPRSIDQSGLDRNEFRVFFYVLCVGHESINPEDRVRDLRVSNIAVTTRMSRPSVKKSLNSLLEKGYLIKSDERFFNQTCAVQTPATIRVSNTESDAILR